MAGVLPSVLHLDRAPRVGQTNDRYASWTIDSSYNRGFVHIRWDNPNLLAAATSLAPSTLRFGGSGNDYLHYAPFSPCSSVDNNETYTCLNTTHWDKLYALAERSGTDFVFGLSFDLERACVARGAYVWQPDAAVAMIKYMLAQKQQVWGFELGNEINNRQVSCALQAAQQAKAFGALAAQLRTLYPDAATRPKLLGPDVGYLQSEAWLGAFLGNYSDLHAVTYHVYSGLKKDSYDEPRMIDHALTGGEGWYVPMVRRLAPNAEVWAGEDGPVGGGDDGTCNGNTPNSSVCGTFATVPWYANDLGVRATLGFRQYQRQDLVGGRYALLAIPHDNEALGATDPLRINPDFWVAFLWKRLMGSAVYNVTSAATSLDPAVRTYGQCGLPPSEHAPPAVAAAQRSPAGAMGLVLINIDPSQPKTVALQSAAANARLTSWTLAAGRDGVFGKASLLNGQLLPAMLSDGVALGAIPVDGEERSGSLELPPFSVTFAVTECAPAAMRSVEVE